ncbi:MAG TPA: MarR family transcriptional regulator [Bacillales bacterium]|nr:MarR family transcriptional regulator [Bacillales bacterium]
MNEASDSVTKQKLLKAFMQFRKAGWHGKSVDGYKPSEIMLLFCLKKGTEPAASQGMKVSEISKRLHVTSPTVTQLLNGLERDGLVERNTDPVDRRAVGIKLTPAGEALTKKASAAFSETFDGLIHYLGEEQSEQLAELLSKVSAYFGEKRCSR